MCNKRRSFGYRALCHVHSLSFTQFILCGTQKKQSCELTDEEVGDCYKQASKLVTDLDNTVSARITVAKDDVTFGVAVRRAVKKAESDLRQSQMLF